MHPRIVARIDGEARNLYIDMLRGACILLVMLLHYSLAYRLQTSPLQAWIPVATLRAIFYNGNYGVDIFFVVSGFLITSNMLARYGSLAGIDIMHFYKLRFFRLYPLLVLALAVITALGLTGFAHFSNIAHQTNLGSGFFLIADLSVLTFWHNLLMEGVGYFNYAMNIYWSLSVEEVFYLLYPLVLAMARRRWQLVLLACVCAVIAPIYRGMHRDNELFFMYGNLACVDMLAYGCVAAVLVNSVTLTSAPRRLLAALACIAMAWIYMQGIHGHEALGPAFLGLTATIFLVVAPHLSASAFTRRLGSPLAWLGSHSYELYLFHIVVLGIMVELVPRAAMPITHKLPMLAIFLVLSAALAWAAARYFGDPLNQWLRHRFARRDVKALPTTRALATDAVRSE